MRSISPKKRHCHAAARLGTTHRAPRPNCDHWRNRLQGSEHDMRLDSQHGVAVLSVDLSKAFERVNPYWILCILRGKNAPGWVARYAEYILFGHAIRHKAPRRLLAPRKVLTGIQTEARAMYRARSSSNLRSFSSSSNRRFESDLHVNFLKF